MSMNTDAIDSYNAMELIPILESVEQNREFVTHPLCKDSLYMTLDFYKSVGFSPPWIGYYARTRNQFVGCAAFKGRPSRGKVEIAYSTFEQFQQKGMGTKICQQLVKLSLATDPTIIITARTLPEVNFSTRILKKSGFQLLGVVEDEDDGAVWEWQYKSIP